MLLSILRECLQALGAPSCQAVAAASQGLANAERTEAGGKSLEAAAGGEGSRMREMSALEREGEEGCLGKRGQGS